MCKVSGAIDGLGESVIRAEGEGKVYDVGVDSGI